MDQDDQGDQDYGHHRDSTATGFKIMGIRIMGITETTDLN